MMVSGNHSSWGNQFSVAGYSNGSFDDPFLGLSLETLYAMYDHPHCPLNKQLLIEECHRCQTGQPGHVSDLDAYLAQIETAINLLEQAK